MADKMKGILAGLADEEEGPTDEADDMKEAENDDASIDAVKRFREAKTDVEALEAFRELMLAEG